MSAGELAQVLELLLGHGRLLGGHRLTEAVAVVVQPAIALLGVADQDVLVHPGQPLDLVLGLAAEAQGTQVLALGFAEHAVGIVHQLGQLLAAEGLRAAHGQGNDLVGRSLLLLGRNQGRYRGLPFGARLYAGRDRLDHLVDLCLGRLHLDGHPLAHLPGHGQILVQQLQFAGRLLVGLPVLLGIGEVSLQQVDELLQVTAGLGILRIGGGQTLLHGLQLLASGLQFAVTAGAVQALDQVGPAGLQHPEQLVGALQVAGLGAEVTLLRHGVLEQVAQFRQRGLLRRLQQLVLFPAGAAGGDVLTELHPAIQPAATDGAQGGTLVNLLAAGRLAGDLTLGEGLVALGQRFGTAMGDRRIGHPRRGAEQSGRFADRLGAAGHQLAKQRGIADLFGCRQAGAIGHHLLIVGASRQGTVVRLLVGLDALVEGVEGIADVGRHQGRFAQQAHRTLADHPGDGLHGALRVVPHRTAHPADQLGHALDAGS